MKNNQSQKQITPNEQKLVLGKAGHGMSFVTKLMLIKQHQETKGKGLSKKILGEIPAEIYKRYERQIMQSNGGLWTTGHVGNDEFNRICKRAFSMSIGDSPKKRKGGKLGINSKEQHRKRRSNRYF